ncbi:MAG: enoyl-CoA hydratase-related protein, partial [Actinomycetota bacterium]
VGSFDGGFGSAYLARQVGQKRAREIFFLGRSYTAAEAHQMGIVNAIGPHAEREETAAVWPGHGPVIGDALAPRQSTEAIREGYLVGRAI